MNASHQHEFTHCPNCRQSLQRSDKFCPACGQRTLKSKLTLHDLLHELIHFYLHIDSAFLNTLRYLGVPGKLTTEFFKDKRKSYFPPLRLMMLSTVILFATIHFTDSEKKKPTQLEFLNDGHNKLLLFNTLDSLKLPLSQQIPQADVPVVVDSLKMKLNSIAAKADDTPDDKSSSATEFSFTADGEKENVTQDEASVILDSVLTGNDSIMIGNQQISVVDFNNLSADELLQKYKVNNFWQKLIFRNFYKIEHEGNNKFIAYFMSKMNWLVFLIIPALAVIFKLLYWRHNRYYSEHITFLIHYFSFAFILFSVALLLAKFFSWDWALGFSILGIFVYLYKAMRNYYSQSRIKTLIKYCVIQTSTFVLFVIIFIFVAVIATLLY
ncbi:MAG: DUF3667 domain-containing protein [Saprospiraceae bacterium]|nr:DUF3667 domain-containing protein [Saprospiraceae bacterium]MBP7699787.1 DUF3667 domain-containing protein [Saprospiraceae bacterium]